MPERSVPLAPTPDPELSARYARCLPGGRLAGPLLAFASVASTQTVARRAAVAGTAEGTVILADHQTAGRGRRGRPWTAPPGAALLLSCVLRPPVPPGRWPELSLLAGLAVADGIEATADRRPVLKWPNDVLVDRRKIAGILAEGAVGAGTAWVVLGIGINVGQRTADWPADLAACATSLAELGRPVARERLLAAVLGRLAAWYESWLAEGFAPVRAAWRARGLWGVRVTGDGGTGIAEDLASDGALVVRDDSGRTRRLVTGTVAEAEVPTGVPG